MRCSVIQGITEQNTHSVNTLTGEAFTQQRTIDQLENALLFGKLITSYTRRGLLCEGLSSQSVDGGCALFGSTLDPRASHDTNLHFSSVVP